MYMSTLVLSRTTHSKNLVALRPDGRNTLRLSGQTMSDQITTDICFTAVPVSVHHKSNGSIVCLLDHTGYVSVHGKTAFVKLCNYGMRRTLLVKMY